jgi:hypothetical protein
MHMPHVDRHLPKCALQLQRKPDGSKAFENTPLFPTTFGFAAHLCAWAAVSNPDQVHIIVVALGLHLVH